jgi:hypothetical protein
MVKGLLALFISFRIGFGLVLHAQPSEVAQHDSISVMVGIAVLQEWGL